VRACRDLFVEYTDQVIAQVHVVQLLRQQQSDLQSYIISEDRTLYNAHLQRRATLGWGV
jgi:hypothetical protein